MKRYITQHQPNKGYIPNDKIRKLNHYFEKFSFSHIPHIKSIWKIASTEYIKNVYENKPAKYEKIIEVCIDEFIKYCDEQGHTITKDVKKYFYFNFNHDGIDIFINRGL